MKKIIYLPVINKLLKIMIGSVASFFFNKKYLRGRYFEEKMMGWYWVLLGIRNKIFGFNRNIEFPCDTSVRIHRSDKIHFDVNDLHIFQSPGCYYNNFAADIYIGKGSYIAPNVGIITANHSVENLDLHEEAKDVVLGRKCWIGMNSVILPGVILGDNTIVGAGSVVTKSFVEGNVIIAGNPARIIKEIRRDN
ncbi:DapH/DapD/GlmU-related protein [Exiguobacterium sp. s183]|uniref:acyltransferase n=1 Tax=Exiguobacterium sp. s183 TaxID=2751262 RepID=UPI001BEAB495|nr:DapH/DapD/GlmU-related protein [Exiguobacterium sp. s183]